MKQHAPARILRALVAILLLSLAALTVTSCGKRANPPCPVCGATYLCDCAVAETVTRAEPCLICGSVQLCDCAQDILEVSASPVWLERPLAYFNLVRTLNLTPIAASGIDTAAGEKMYAKAGIGTIRFAELPTQFEIKWDERIEAESVTVTRYSLYDHTKGEICELTENKLVFEAGYYYEIALLTPTGTETYGVVTAAERTIPTSPTNPRDVNIGYTYLGTKKQKRISSSLSSAYWNGKDPSSGEVVQTAASAPYQLPGLCEINATEAQVTLFENMEIAAFVISTIPVDENNELILGSGGESAKFTVVNNTFELLEGSHYYGVYVCFDGRSFDRYGFIAHYDPDKTAEDDPVAALPILTEAPPLRLTRPIYGAEASEIVNILYPYGSINSDRPTAPFEFAGKYVVGREAGVDLRIVPDSSMKVQSITVRYYPRSKLSEWKYYDASDGTIRLEQDYCYEIDVVCENGRAIYGIGCMKNAEPSAEPIAEPDIFVRYGYLTTTFRQMTYNSAYHVNWREENGEMIVTDNEFSRPFRELPNLPQIKPTSAEAKLYTRDGRPVSVYAVAAFPLDETGMMKEYGEWTQCDMDRIPYGADYPQSFTLLEGSYYYEIYVCNDTTSYDLYAFVAHYTPNETGGSP